MWATNGYVPAGPISADRFESDAVRREASHERQILVDELDEQAHELGVEVTAGAPVQLC